MLFAHPAEHARSLLEMPCDCCLLVEELTGSPALRSRLHAMGILPGTKLELHRGGCGAMQVRVKDCSLVINKELAGFVFCRPTEGPPKKCCLERRQHEGPGEPRSFSFKSFCRCISGLRHCAKDVAQPLAGQADVNTSNHPEDGGA